ncbi:M48 family metalloprotease [Sphingomonas antarctica]|uniref:M48 family metalloprotease n=1 Tax=Sphingomonas antarctica TaxID=2040274 RepID=UPI0039E82100
MLSLLLALTAPAAPDPLAIADARVAQVSWRLQTANVALCPQHAPLPGLSLQMRDQYGPADRAATGLGDRPTLSAVVPGSAAARAGLKVGDALAGINGTATPVASDKGATFATVGRADAQLAAALAKGDAMIVFGDGRSVTLTPDQGCASEVQLLPQKGLNAGADGQIVQIGGKLYDFAANDDELAAVIAHELSHNFLGHRNQLDEAGVSTGLFSGLGKNGAKLRQIEFEADRLSVWLVARAGYRVDALPPFWARLGQRAGILISDGTHPGFKERVRRIEAAVAEVATQRAAGQPLIPPVQ